MKTLLTILLLSLMSFETISQNDTLLLFDNYIIFQGKKFNTVINGIKQGNWIDFSIEGISYLMNASGFDQDTGESVHWEIDEEKEYRALKPLEREGERYILSESAKKTSAGIVKFIWVKVIHSKVPSGEYYITASGKYENDLKTGKWIYYNKSGVITAEGDYKNGIKTGKWFYCYDSGTIRKEIEYLNGLPTSGFKICRENGTLMFGIIRLNNFDWKICRYSEKGDLLDCEIKKINEFRSLY